LLVIKKGIIEMGKWIRGFIELLGFEPKLN